MFRIGELDDTIHSTLSSSSMGLLDSNSDAMSMKKLVKSTVSKVQALFIHLDPFLAMINSRKFHLVRVTSYLLNNSELETELFL